MVEVKRFSVGELAARAGVATSALRFYEANRLDHVRAQLRRVTVATGPMHCAALLSSKSPSGSDCLSARSAKRWRSLPSSRTPTRDDWNELASRWLPRIDDQIAALELLRDRLDGCIGCGCLSLDTCELYNTGDRAARRGAGARYLLGDPIEVG